MRLRREAVLVPQRQQPGWNLWQHPGQTQMHYCVRARTAAVKHRRDRRMGRRRPISAVSAEPTRYGCTDGGACARARGLRQLPRRAGHRWFAVPAVAPPPMGRATGGAGAAERVRHYRGRRHRRWRNTGTGAGTGGSRHQWRRQCQRGTLAPALRQPTGCDSTVTDGSTEELRRHRRRRRESVVAAAATVPPTGRGTRSAGGGADRSQPQPRRRRQ